MKGEYLDCSIFRWLVRRKSIAGSPRVSAWLCLQRLVSGRRLHREVRAEVEVKKIKISIELEFIDV